MSSTLNRDNNPEQHLGELFRCCHCDYSKTGVTSDGGNNSDASSTIFTLEFVYQSV